MTFSLLSSKGYFASEAVTPNGSTDCTSAIQDCFDSAAADNVPAILEDLPWVCGTVNIPEALHLITLNASIRYKAGASSPTAIFDHGANGRFFHSGYLQFLGPWVDSTPGAGTPEGYYVAVNMDGGQGGGCARIHYDHLRVNGFDKRGVAIARVLTSLHGAGPTFNTFEAENCWLAFDAGSLAESIVVKSGAMRNNRVALRNTGGNNRYTINACDNWTAVLLEVNDPVEHSDNDNHGIFTGHILHNGKAIVANDVDKGFLFNNCSIYDGEFRWTDSRGIYVQNSLLSGVTGYFDGGGPCGISYNPVDDRSPCTWNHNYNSHTSYVTINDNPVFRP